MKTIKSLLAAIFFPNIQEVYKSIDSYLETVEALKRNAPLYGYTEPEITVIERL